MPERTGSVDEKQVKLDRLRRLYALHDPMASEEQVNTWIEESVDANDNHEDSYGEQTERVEDQIHIEQGDARDADIRRIKENGELFANVSDLADNLTLDRAGRVRYAMGAIAMEGNVGGRFTPRRWLEIINAHADEIRDGLEYRNEAVMSATEREDRAAEVEENRPFKVIDKRYSHTIENDEETLSSPDTTVISEAVTTGEFADKPLILSFIDQTHDALAAARDAAEARRRDDVQQGGRWRKFMKNMWMGENGIAGAYYLEKYKKHALDGIEQTNDIYIHESHDSNANTQAQLATIERFQSEYEESIHEDAGEKRAELADDSQFSIRAKELITRYVNGDITNPEALTEERGRILEELGSSELIGEGKVRIDNMAAIAEQVKAMVDHGQSIESVLEGMKIYSAEARSNVRSEAHLGKIERTIDRLQKSKLGGFVSPETIGVTAAIALGVARAGRGTLLRAAGVTLVPGVLGGAFAAMRESKRIKEERAIHSREMAQGKEYGSGKRRDQMETTRYETIAAQEVTLQLESTLRSNGEEPLTPENVQEAYELIAVIEARIRLSDMRDIDLVSYSSVTSIERERQQLDEARALAKQRLGEHMVELPLDFKQRFTITDGQSVNDSLQSYTEATVDIATDMSAKDQAYRKLRRRRVATAAATGAATSLFIGLGTQELIAAIDPTYDGLIEHAVQGGSPSEEGRQTVLEAMTHGQSNSTSTEKFAPSSTYESHEISSNGAAIELPSGYSLATNADGTLTMQAPDGGESINGLSVDKNGSLSEASLAILAEHNVTVADNGGFVETKSTSSKTLNVAEYNEINKDDTTHIKRDFWYDNNTAKFDKNELGLDWNGGDGVASNGTIQMNVSGMTEGGSSHNLEKTSWSQTAKEGELKLAISGSRDTQAQVYMVDVQPNGTIDIPQDSPAAQFFSTSNGHAEFNGAYAEVVDIRSETGGTTHVAPLATIVGDGSAKEFTQTVTTTTKEYVPKFIFTPPETQLTTGTAGRTVEGFGAPGIIPRRALEKLEIRRKGPKGWYGRDPQPERKNVFSPRLEADSNRELKLGEELEWFAKDLESREGTQYVNKIRQGIHESPELRTLTPNIKTVTTIPVAAASESENIFNSLSLYAQQDEDSLKNNVILLNVNWLDTAKNDPEKSVNINKTFSEIERARKEFPQLKIATITNEYKDIETKKTGGVIGYVASDLMNTALLALEEKMTRGEFSSDTDVTIVRQDADMKGMSRHYLRQLEKYMKQNKSVDIFNGTIRDDVRMHSRYPGFGITANFTRALQLAHASVNKPWTVGVNIVARASSLAAVGGLGKLGWTGPASDDVEIGQRISAARGARESRQLDYSSRLSDSVEHRIVVSVPGMSVDSAADRLIQQYLKGRPTASAWNSTSSDGTSFTDGPGGYRDRKVGSEIMDEIPQEHEKSDILYERIETNFSDELSNADEKVARKVLSVFFANVPNAYVITGDIGSGSAVKFTFTKAGREFISDRIAKEANGHAGIGSRYGERKMRQVYGEYIEGGPKPLAAQSPFVKPINKNKEGE